MPPLGGRAFGARVGSRSGVRSFRVHRHLLGRYELQEVGPHCLRREPNRILIPAAVLDPLLGDAVELDGERDEQAGEQFGKPELAGHGSRLYRVSPKSR